MTPPRFRLAPGFLQGQGRALAVAALLLATLFGVHDRRANRSADRSTALVSGGVSVADAALVFPDAERVRPDSGNESGWTLVFNSEGTELGTVVATQPFMNAVHGYAGPVPVVVGFELDGTIAGVVLLENAETPGFVRRVRETGYLDLWQGLTLAEAARFGPDAVSGATMTSVAIAASISGRLQMIDGISMSPREAGQRAASWFSFGWVDAGIVALAVMAAIFTLGQAFWKRRRVLPLARYLLMVGTVLLLGFGAGVMFSMSLLEAWATAGSFYGSVGGIVLVVLALVFPLLSGTNMYCRYLCPFGALQECLFRMTPCRVKLTPSVYKKLRSVRYVLLITLALSLLFGFGVTADMQEPFSAFRWRSAGLPAIVIAVAALLISLCGINRPWCSFFCSSGALLDSLRKRTGRQLAKKDKSGSNS